MKIEIWSDYTCPFCYIGKRRLELAVEELPFKGEIEIEYKSFELDANAPKKYDGSIHELIAKKYGISVERAKGSNDQIVSQAKSLGLLYDFDRIKPTNTFDAHRLTQFSKTIDKQHEISEALFRAYFTEGKNLSDVEELAKISSCVGIEYKVAIDILESNQYAEAVRDDEDQAREYGVTGVPYFVINDKFAVSGAQPIAVLKKTLEDIYNPTKGESYEFTL